MRAKERVLVVAALWASSLLPFAVAQHAPLALQLGEPHPVASPARGRWRARVEGPFVLEGATEGSGAARVLVRARELGEGVLVVEDEEGSRRLPLRALDLALVRAGAPVDPATDALSVSARLPNDASLPRDPRAERADDPEAFRVVVRGARARSARWRRLEPLTGVTLEERTLALVVESNDSARSAFLRLVADAQDAAAPGVAARLMRVALGDVVELEVDGLTRRWLVGRPGEEAGPRAHRRAQLRVVVVRVGGLPAVGGDEAGAALLAREQVAIANAIFAPCHVDFGAASDVEVVVHDVPSEPTMLAIGDDDGLPSLGGEVRFRVGGRRVGPLTIPPGRTPEQSAALIAAAIERLGLSAFTAPNPRTRRGAGSSVDVWARDARGQPVPLTADGEHPLTTDRRQSLRLARVELADGLDAFEDGNARAGTIEERALVRALADDDPTTLDVLVIPRFSRAERRGEAFIPSDGSPLAPAVLIDRQGVAGARSSYTLAHELGHVLLDLPFHPDELGAPDPTRLLSSRGSDPTLWGPKRLTADECHRLRARGEANALLRAPEPSRR